MTTIDQDTHIFIVRIWIERREFKDAPPEWRGVVEYVRSNEQRFLKSFDEMIAFMEEYLQSSGVSLE